MLSLKRFIAVLTVMPALFSCGGGTDVEQPAEPAPRLVSTSPADGATGLKGTSLDVVFTMDQNVKVTSAGSRLVTVSGGASITSVNAYNKDVTVKLEGLENGGNYTVSVPAGVIEGFKENQEAAAAVSVTFTMEYVEPEKHYDRAPAASLSNARSTGQAARLYAYLLDNYGKKTVSGAMGGTAWETSYTDNIQSLTGVYPAIVGFDYIFNNWAERKAEWSDRPDYTDIAPVKQAWDARNIIQIGWHWCVPGTTEDAFESSGGKRYIDSYSYSNRAFSVREALKEGTWQNTEMKKQLKQVAGFLKLLQDAGIPVLWRPLHEAAGDYTWGAWFWWGYDGAEACKELWRYMYREFTVTYGLGNLIWVWTAQTTDGGKLSSVDKLRDWYPGDEYVDLVGADLYVAKNTTQSAAFQLVNDSVEGHKMVVLSEFGNLLDIDGFFSEDAPWGYFMNWCNFEEGAPVLWCKNSDGSYSWNNTADDWKSALSNTHTINRKDVPSFK
uniref:Beta-mannanase n=1 Tax=uncultured microorganism TaxID=358574 RepID=B1PLK2_9ZZZZ|nr:beta-mannanase [uncultured microorganism]